MSRAAERAGTGQCRRRFRSMLRGRQNSLALASVGLVAAAILGVQLGQSAIAEIDPIHFQGPQERPRAITPSPEPAPYNPYAQTYVWSMPPPPAADCGPDCDTAHARRVVQLALDETAGRDPALPYWRDATPATELRPWPPGETPDRGLPLERYMRYPVNREQAERAAAVPAPAPVPAVVPAGAEALRPPAPVAGPAVED